MRQWKKDPGEHCDIGTDELINNNSNSNRGCLRDCTFFLLRELFITRKLSPGLTHGNGILDINNEIQEQCDDRNFNSNDGCSWSKDNETACQFEGGFKLLADSAPYGEFEASGCNIDKVTGFQTILDPNTNEEMNVFCLQEDPNKTEFNWGTGWSLAAIIARDGKDTWTWHNSNNLVMNSPNNQKEKFFKLEDEIYYKHAVCVALKEMLKKQKQTMKLFVENILSY